MPRADISKSLLSNFLSFNDPRFRHCEATNTRCQPYYLYYGFIYHYHRFISRHIHTDTGMVILSFKLNETGIQAVGYFASAFLLSANYFGDLIKKETGKTEREYIQAKLVGVAKEKILDPAKTVSEVAYELGFKYPQHFTRLLKQQLDYTPYEYRSSMN